MTKYIESGDDPLVVSVAGLDCLDEALLAGQRTVVEFLVGHGVAIERRSSNYNALDLPAISGDVRVACAALALGARVNGSMGRRQPIFWAIQEARVNMVRFLIENGSRVNAIDRACQKDKLRALDQAAAQGHDRIVMELIKAGAWRNARDADGCTALDKAILYRRDTTAELLSMSGRVRSRSI